MQSDLGLAFRLVDAADAATLSRWNSGGVVSTLKDDGTPVTDADVAAERAMLAVLRQDAPNDGFLGEELGKRTGATSRRWIVDGIDGTRFYAAGEATWGTLVALEEDDEIVLGVSSSPAQNRRWWAHRGRGAFTGTTDLADVTRLSVSTKPIEGPKSVATLPTHRSLSAVHQHVVEQLANGKPPDMPWSHQNRVAEGEIDACVWFGGDTWDHAAPSIIVEEAGGRFTDHWGGKRLDTRTAVYSNGLCHDEVLTALQAAHP